MATAAAPCAPATSRLLTALPRLGAHDARLPVAADAPDAITELARVRFHHLGEVDRLLQQQRLPEIRVDKLLAFHQLALMWLADLAGTPLEPCDVAEGIDRAVVDTTVALLLWHAARNFHATQRLVQFCLLDIDPAAHQPRRVASWHDSAALTGRGFPSRKDTQCS